MVLYELKWYQMDTFEYLEACVGLKGGGDYEIMKHGDDDKIGEVCMF